jgi:hypothetical protein
MCVRKKKIETEVEKEKGMIDGEEENKIKQKQTK